MFGCAVDVMWCVITGVDVRVVGGHVVDVVVRGVVSDADVCC